MLSFVARAASQSAPRLSARVIVAYPNAVTAATRHFASLSGAHTKRRNALPSASASAAVPARHMSDMFTHFVDNLKRGFRKNKEIQENLKKLAEEKRKLEETEAVKTAMKTVGAVAETTQEGAKAGAGKLADMFKTVSDSVSSAVGGTIGEAKVVKDAADTAKAAADKVAESSKIVVENPLVQKVSEGVKAITDELVDEGSARFAPYSKPKTRRRRTIKKAEESYADIPESGETRVVLHKDSMWQSQWKDFKENNPLLQSLFSFKQKVDESDNVLVRATKAFTSRLADTMGTMFAENETAQCLAEIAKVDPKFNKERFVQECELEIIPTVLEAYLNGDVEILNEWLHEPAFNVLASHIKMRNEAGLFVDAKILDIRGVDLALARVMEQGPVLVLMFTAQQTMVVRDKGGRIVEGNPDKIEDVYYTWALCRDQSIYDPANAWRVMEMAVQMTRETI